MSFANSNTTSSISKEDASYMVLLQSGVAVAGTLVLEFSRLSQYSYNSTYKELAEKAMRTVVKMVCGMNLVNPALIIVICIVSDRATSWSTSAGHCPF